SASSAGSATIRPGPFAPNTANKALVEYGALRTRAVASSAACAGVVPSRKRAIELRIVTAGGGGTRRGRHTRVPGSGNSKSGGITPTRVTLWPFTAIGRPMPSAAPANRAIQKPYDNTTSGASSVVKTRPTSGDARSIANVPGVAHTAYARSYT